MISSPPDPLDFRGVQRAYDTVAADYAAYLPDKAAGLREVCRLVRRAQGKERDDQAILLVRSQ